MPVFALPLPRGRYRLVYEHPVDPPTADTPDAVREFTQRCTDVLEMYVRRHPELWLWMHRRGGGPDGPGADGLLMRREPPPEAGVLIAPRRRGAEIGPRSPRVPPR